ncbi:MAG: mechanosensitive ion channel family protein, partial [Gemmatimonadota bacterium]
VYAGDTLFMLFGRLGPFGPAERAAAAEGRLQRWGRNLGSGVDSVTVNEAEQRSELLVHDEVLMTVLDSDAAALGQSRSAAAALFAARIRTAAAAGVKATSLTGLAIDAAKAVVATICLVLLLVGLGILFRRAYTLLRGPRISPLRIKRFELLSAARLGEALTVLARGIRIVVTLILLYIYIPLVLSFFPWTAPYSSRIAGYILTPLNAVWSGFLDYLPKIFFIAVIVLVTRYLLKLIHLVFQAIGNGSLVLDNFRAEWADPTYNIVRFLVLAFAAVVMFPYLPGAGSDAFKGVSLFVGVLFSLGSSGAVGNIVAGVVLTYTGAFRIGDRVRIGDTIGDVVERTLLITRVRTPKNVEITIPNGTVLSSQVVNYSTQAADKGLILHTTVTIGYDAPWRQVHELLISAARATADIHSDPAPFVLQTSLDDFYVSYELNAYTDNPAIMQRTYSELHQRIQDEFNRHGVEIMSPHYRAQRDGNLSSIPAEHLAKDYQAPAFRVEQVESSKPKT